MKSVIRGFAAVSTGRNCGVCDWPIASSLLFSGHGRKQHHHPTSMSAASLNPVRWARRQFLSLPGLDQTYSLIHTEATTATAEMKDRISGAETYFIPSERKDMAKIIDGKKIAEDIRHELREQVENSVAKGHKRPQLIAVLVGEDPASQTYVNNKMKAAADVGIDSVTKRLPKEISEEDLLTLVSELNDDESVDGILVQLPLPGHINERRVCNAISCDKDVDGFNEKNVGRLCLDMHSLIPCTPLGVQLLLKRTGIETYGKNAVVVGRSKNVGMPISMLLHADGANDTNAMDATVTICHRYTPPEELKRFCLSADIIVSATGVPGLIRGDMVKPGACVIDVGLTRIQDPVTGKNKLVGDVVFDDVKEVAGHITPVPGGVGPMTVAMLMKNTIIAAENLEAKRRAGLPRDL